MPTRRDLLKHTVAAAAACLAVPAIAAPVPLRTATCVETADDKARREGYERRIDRVCDMYVEELEKYAAELKRLHPDRKQRSINVPFSTTPIPCYVRESEGMYDPVEITPLRHGLEVGYPGLTQDIFQRYARKQVAQRMPWSNRVDEIKKPRADQIAAKSKELVSDEARRRFALMLPGRVITPAYTYCLDRAELTNGSLAFLIVASVEALIEAAARNTDTAIQAYVASPHMNPLPRKLVHEHSDTNIRLKLDGVLLEAYAWMDVRGVVCSEDSRVSCVTDDRLQ